MRALAVAPVLQAPTPAPAPAGPFGALREATRRNLGAMREVRALFVVDEPETGRGEREAQ